MKNLRELRFGSLPNSMLPRSLMICAYHPETDWNDLKEIGRVNIRLGLMNSIEYALFGQNRGQEMWKSVIIIDYKKGSEGSE